MINKSNPTILSLNWIMNNNQDKVEKSLMDIREYLESMVKVSDVGGVDNVGFKGGQLEMIEISLDDDDDLVKSPEKVVSPDFPPEPPKLDLPAAKSKWGINWFDVKMIFIGTTALMFARITGLSGSKM